MIVKAVVNQRIILLGENKEVTSLNDGSMLEFDIYMVAEKETVH